MNSRTFVTKLSQTCCGVRISWEEGQLTLSGLPLVPGVSFPLGIPQGSLWLCYAGPGILCSLCPLGWVQTDLFVTLHNTARLGWKAYQGLSDGQGRTGRKESQHSQIYYRWLASSHLRSRDSPLGGVTLQHKGALQVSEGERIALPSEAPHTSLCPKSLLSLRFRS